MALGYPQETRLTDGRRLGYHEFGDPHGTPCLYIPGWPASGLLGGIYHDAALATGVRWIAVDKPGTGRSDPDPRRSLSHYAADLAELADRLDLGRFAVAGESGGAPRALAVAHALPGRVRLAVVLAGIGQTRHRRARASLPPGTRRLLGTARHAPWLLRLRMARLSRALHDPVRARAWEHSFVLDAAPVDRLACARFEVSLVLPAAVEAVRDRGRAATQELRMIAGPWGFALSEIAVPVRLWHGVADPKAPLALAMAMVAEIPGCRAQVVGGQGHNLGPVLRREVLASIAQDVTAIR